MKDKDLVDLINNPMTSITSAFDFLATLAQPQSNSSQPQSNSSSRTSRRRTSSHRSSSRRSASRRVNDLGVVRMQLLSKNLEYWNNVGFSSLLLTMYSHNNLVYEHTVKSLMKKRYTYETNIDTNTARLGLTDDRGLVGYKDYDYSKKAKIGIADVLGVPPDKLDFTGNLNIYQLGDILFTTSFGVKYDSIYTDLHETSITLPCIGIIQDLLTTYMLTTKTSEYYKNNQLQSYTEITKNHAVDTLEGYVPFDSNGLHTYLLPFLGVQSGRGNGLLFNIDFTFLDTSSDITELIELGTILPLAKIVRLEDPAGEYLLPLALDENGLYRLDTIRLGDSIKTNKVQLDTYTKEDLNTLDKTAMYSQAVIDTINALRRCFGIKEMEDNLLAENITLDTTDCNTTNSSYICPTALVTDKEFII